MLKASYVAKLKTLPKETIKVEKLDWNMFIRAILNNGKIRIAQSVEDF